MQNFPFSVKIAVSNLEYVLTMKLRNRKRKIMRGSYGALAGTINNTYILYMQENKLWAT
jgi:hypothetical protein